MIAGTTTWLYALLAGPFVGPFARSYRGVSVRSGLLCIMRSLNTGRALMAPRRQAPGGKRAAWSHPIDKGLNLTEPGENVYEVRNFAVNHLGAHHCFIVSLKSALSRSIRHQPQFPAEASGVVSGA